MKKKDIYYKLNNNPFKDTLFFNYLVRQIQEIRQNLIYIDLN